MLNFSTPLYLKLAQHVRNGARLDKENTQLGSLRLVLHVLCDQCICNMCTSAEYVLSEFQLGCTQEHEAGLSVHGATQTDSVVHVNAVFLYHV